MVAVGSNPTPGTMNISKADLARLDELLPTIGIDEKTANMGGTVLGDAMIYVAQVIIDKLKESLTEKGAYTRAKQLMQSIKADIPNVTPQGATIGIEMINYYQWVESGRRPGKRPPIKSIEEWITSKGIQVRQSKGESGQSVLDRRKSMAIAIAGKIASKGTIKRFGYKGSNFIADVLTPQNVDTIAQKLSDLTGLRLQAYVTTEIAE
jgi:hypothetical protein